MGDLYTCNQLTGGDPDALDSIDGNELDGDSRAMVITSAGYYYFYYLDPTSGASESSPDVITPDTNPGNKRWIKASAG